VNLAMENDGLGRQRFWRDFIGSCDWIWMNGRLVVSLLWRVFE
jgi:hypothetical protein